MVRLDAETKQITHAIRMAAYNAETTLARALDGHYARAGDEAYALIREALTVSGDICPGDGELLVQLDPLTAPRRTQALAALCDQLTAAGARYPGTDIIELEDSSVPGATIRCSRSRPGNSLARAASTVSPVQPRGTTWRRSTATSCRRTKISASFAASLRTRSTSQPSTRTMKR